MTKASALLQRTHCHRAQQAIVSNMLPNAVARLAGSAVLASAIGCAAANPHPAPAPTIVEHWVDSTLASLTLRERVGQMVMIWMLGDYTNTRDTTYAEIIRWVETGRHRRCLHVARHADRGGGQAQRPPAPRSGAAPRQLRPRAGDSAGSRADCSRTICSRPAARRSFRRNGHCRDRRATRTPTTWAAHRARRAARSAFTSISRPSST